jgi:uncharacterized protein (DUF1499 family)
MLLESLAELAPVPTRRGFRRMPSREGDLQPNASSVFDVSAEQLWRAWLLVTSHQARTRLLARDDQARRSLHVQRSRVFRFPDEVRAEIVALDANHASIAIDSRARYGYYDFGVNRRRVETWLGQLADVLSAASG